MNTKKILGVVAVLALVAVAMVGAGAANTATVSTYDQFTNAISTLSAGDTIQLSASFAVTTETFIPSGKDLILDLNGKTLSTSGGTNQGGMLAVARGAKLTIKDSGTGGTIDATTSGSEYYAAVKVTYSTDGGNGTAELIVNSGTLKGYIAGICGNGNRDGYSITVNGGTVKGCYTGSTEPYTGWGDTGSTGIYAPSNGTVTINGGTVEGYNSAIEIRGGSLTVTAGTLVSTYTGDFVCTGNGNGMTTKGAAVAVAQHNTKKVNNVTINGGTFTASTGYGISVGNPQGNSGDAVKDSVTVTANKPVTLHLATIGTDEEKAKLVNMFNLDAGSSGKVTVDNTWDNVKLFIDTAATGATVKASDATMEFTKDYNASTSTTDIDSCVSKVTEGATSGTTDVTAKAVMRYQVTIPSSVTLTTSATTADYSIKVINPTTESKNINMKLESATATTSGNVFAVTLNGTKTATEYMTYTIYNTTNSRDVGFESDLTKLIVQKDATVIDNPAKSTLTYSAVNPTGVKQGSYSEKLTFTISVDDKQKTA